MTESPSATLTFLFTDLEVRRLPVEEHPGAMRIALAHHDGLVRGAVERRGGRVVKSTGDARWRHFGPRDGVGGGRRAGRAMRDDMARSTGVARPNGVAQARRPSETAIGSDKT
jgi:class 3 adenylate cyclase